MWIGEFAADEERFGVLLAGFNNVNTISWRSSAEDGGIAFALQNNVHSMVKT
jgi:hypothetical protein